MTSSLPHIVETDQGDIEIPQQTGQNLRDQMLEANISLSPGCNGTGQCGRCKIQLIYGKVVEPGLYETERLSSDEIRSGIRLACQALPTESVRLKQLGPGLSRTWSLMEIEEGSDFSRMSATGLSDQNSYAMAVDLGTSRIRVSLCDIKQGKRLLACAGTNPQASYGLDVLTRIARAVESDNQARKLSTLAKNAIKSGMNFVAARLQVDLKNVGRVLISGNTAMLTLLTGVNFDRLLLPEYWMKKIPCQPENREALQKGWQLPADTRIEFSESLAGFVGSDLVAAVLATGLKSEKSSALLIDFGTNSEIALWDENHLWVTAAAGGPAFELGTSEFGMPAVEGAVYRFEQQDSNRAPHYNVIGGGTPKGICGSAMVDMIASMVSQGHIKLNGNFSGNLAENKIQVLEGLWLYKKDVDAFQRAKAAVAAGINCLLKRADKKTKDLKRLYVCGTFGQYLHFEHAQAIGLLPTMSEDRIELWGEAALLGTEQMLLKPELTSNKIFKDTTVINLSSDPGFETHFINNLLLKPLNDGK